VNKKNPVLQSAMIEPPPTTDRTMAALAIYILVAGCVIAAIVFGLVRLVHFAWFF